MVKNTKGGKGAKSMARKSLGSSGGIGFPIPTSDMEQFAVVNKMYGPNCEVLFIDGSKMLCHIRNKFKGRHKSGNLISVGSLILVGYREWESDTARKNCDLLFVYDHIQKYSLEERFSLPSLSNSLYNSFSHDNFSFEHSYTQTIPTQTSTSTFTDTNILQNFDDL